MNNLEIANSCINSVRKVIEIATVEKEFRISMEELLGVLACLERLSIIERHLINLVSAAYEEVHIKEEKK